MKITLGLFAIAAIVYLVLDMLWLLVIARGFYQAEIGALLKPQPDLLAAVCSMCSISWASWCS